MMDRRELIKKDDYRPFYYITNDKISSIIRVHIELKERVDGELLKKAAEDSIQRYPYFSIMAAIDGSEYVNVYNDRPIVVKQGRAPVTLGAAEANYHMLAVCYEENSIYIDVSHCMTDGHGFLPFVKLLVASYFKYAKGIPVDAELTDETMIEKEVGDPYENVDFSHADKPMYRKKVDEFYHLKDAGLNGQGQRVVHRLKIDERSLMKYTSAHDGTPNVILAALLAKVIWENDPDLKLPLKVGVGCDWRPALNHSRSYRQLSNTYELIYDAGRRNDSIEKLCTAGRGMLILQSDPDNVRCIVKQSLAGYAQLRMIPTIAMKRQLLATRTLDARGTVALSYVGRVSFGEADALVDKMDICVDVIPENCMVIELLSLNGAFYLNILQGFDDDRILESFLKRLEAESIPYEVLAKEEVIIPKMDLSWLEG